MPFLDHQQNINAVTLFFRFKTVHVLPQILVPSPYFPEPISSVQELCGSSSRRARVALCGLHDCKLTIGCRSCCTIILALKNSSLWAMVYLGPFSFLLKPLAFALFTQASSTTSPKKNMNIPHFGSIIILSFFSI